MKKNRVGDIHLCWLRMYFCFVGFEMIIAKMNGDMDLSLERREQRAYSNMRFFARFCKHSGLEAPFLIEILNWRSVNQNSDIEYSSHMTYSYILLKTIFIFKGLPTTLTLECTLELQMEMKRTNVKDFFP